MTKRGSDIANAVFRTVEELPLDDDVEQGYLRNILQQVMQRPRPTIVPKLADGTEVAIRLTNRAPDADVTEKASWKRTRAAPLLSNRLRALLEWAEEKYDVQICDEI
ncbi:hypothetical protein ACVWZ4_003809 [Bradyrhizobium sp. USDA 4472]